MTSTSRTARCGPACRVVWQGSDPQGRPLCRSWPPTHFWRSPAFTLWRAEHWRAAFPVRSSCRSNIRIFGRTRAGDGARAGAAELRAIRRRRRTGDSEFGGLSSSCARWTGLERRAAISATAGSRNSSRRCRPALRRWARRWRQIRRLLPPPTIPAATTPAQAAAAVLCSRRPRPAR